MRTRALRIAGGVRELAQQLGYTPAQVALAWLRAQPGTIIPIIGSRRVEQFAENLGCVDVALDAEATKRLAALSQVELGFPHDFLSSPGVQTLIHGTTTAQIDLTNRPNLLARR